MCALRVYWCAWIEFPLCSRAWSQRKMTEFPSIFIQIGQRSSLISYSLSPSHFSKFLNYLYLADFSIWGFWLETRIEPLTFVLFVLAMPEGLCTPGLVTRILLAQLSSPGLLRLPTSFAEILMPYVGNCQNLLKWLIPKHNQTELPRRKSQVGEGASSSDEPRIPRWLTNHHLEASSHLSNSNSSFNTSRCKCQSRLMTLPAPTSLLGGGGNPYAHEGPQAHGQCSKHMAHVHN